MIYPNLNFELPNLKKQIEQELEKTEINNLTDIPFARFDFPNGIGLSYETHDDTNIAVLTVPRNLTNLETINKFIQSLARTPFKNAPQRILGLMS